MTSQNTSIKEFIIGGFDTTNNPVAVGLVILFVYFVVVVANIVIIVIIINTKELHKPMYLLICNLAVADILYTSSASPTMILVLVAGVKTISYVPCLVQVFAFNLGGVMEMFAIAVMAFDRLLAVSFPFHYHSYLTNARTLVLTYILWMVGFSFVSVFPAILIPLPHCYKLLKYTFCDYASVIRTTCVDPNYYFNLVAIIIFFVFVFFTFAFICLSYVGILYFVKLSSTNERKKMSSTCLSHLIVVTCYYCPVFIISILTRIGVVLTLEARNGLSIGSILGPSLVNPFVYCLRTKKIKDKIVNMFKRG